MRGHIEASVLSELVRKVDWLADEVSNLKQALSIYENRVSNRLSNGYYESSARHESWRGNLAIRGERVPSSDVSSYRTNPPVYIESSRETAFSREERSTPPAGMENHPTLYRKYSCSSYPYDSRHPPEYDPEKNPHSTRALAFDTAAKYEHKYNPSDSPGSSSSKSDRLQPIETVNPDVNFTLSDNLTLSEIIQLWQHGLDEIPPILNWSAEQKLQHREKLDIFFRIYHLYRISCHGNINRFVAEYGDSNGLNASRVASLCPDISEAYTAFLNAQPDTASDKNLLKEIYTLPRKINGRKVSAKDVIQLWEHGMGDIPPIRTWNKSQKFKQQSKISRWKKIVDIFKYQCNSDMKTFTQIYSDGHGCLLPVAAITSKFETVYGDELSITSKLMTVSTSADLLEKANSDADDTESKKRKLEEESFEKERSAEPFPNHHEGEKRFKSPPALIRSSSPPPHKLMKDDSSPTSESSLADTLRTITVTVADEQRPETIKMIECKREQMSEETSPHPLTPYQDDEPNNKEKVNPNDSWMSLNTSDSDTNEPPKINLNDVTEASMAASRMMSPRASHIPDNINVKDAIVLWEKGSNELSPIKKWTPQQKENQKDLVSRIEKIYYIYSDIFKRNYKYFLRECSNEHGELQTMEEILSKFHSFLVERGPFIPQSIGISTSSMTFDFSHHKTLTQSTDELYLLPRKINGRKVNAKDVLQLWYHGVNKIPPVKHWSPQQKAVQQSKISRWKKIVDLYEQDFRGNWEHFESHFSNSSGQLLPISAIIAKHEEENRELGGSTEAHLYH